VCRESATLSDAGRKLFAATRENRKRPMMQNWRLAARRKLALSRGGCPENQQKKTKQKTIWLN
jgi:sigma54-dependent transcription regulator